MENELTLRHNLEGASAIVATEGDVCVVGIGNLRVVIVQDGHAWIAHGLEIDYVSQGETIEEAKKNFEDGLRATVCQNLNVYGNIERVLSPAPAEVWTELIYTRGAQHKFFSQFTAFKLENVPEYSFEGISYLQVAGAGVGA
ncbi:MAG TPA: hypothetical protein VMV31_00105 [Terriglobales bacterium]|nr:hypothetical protein [Terriglobales bacterium]